MKKSDDIVFIYGLLCPKNKIIKYVGQTTDILRRLNQHKRKYKGFVPIVLYIANEDNKAIMEKMFVKKFKETVNNIMLIDKYNSSYVIRIDEDFKAKMRLLSKHYKIKEWASIIRKLIDEKIKKIA